MFQNCKDPSLFNGAFEESDPIWKNNDILTFISSHQIPVFGGCERPHAVFDPVGKKKLVTASLVSHGVSAAELSEKASAIFLSFPFLTDYPENLIVHELKKYFSDVTLVTFTGFQPNQLSPLASYLAYFDQPAHWDMLIEQILSKTGNAKFVFMPPVLGIHNHFAFYQKLQQTTNKRVVELLSALPSSAGLRLQNRCSRA